MNNLDNVLFGSDKIKAIADSLIPDSKSSLQVSRVATVSSSAPRVVAVVAFGTAVAFGAVVAFGAFVDFVVSVAVVTVVDTSRGPDGGWALSHAPRGANMPSSAAPGSAPSRVPSPGTA